MISEYVGTLGSGKTYHSIESIIEHLEKKKPVIANFELNFTAGQIRRGLADLFMFIPDNFLYGTDGIALLIKISLENGWNLRDDEGYCLVVLDEVSDYYPREDAAKPLQKFWAKFLRNSRKFNYDFIFILQDEFSINKTISKCIEYSIKHRKANNIFPFSILNRFPKFMRVTIFWYITYWKQQKQRLRSDSSIYIKAYGNMYNTKKIFSGLDEEIKIDYTGVIPIFGNCNPNKATEVFAEGGTRLAGGAISEAEGAMLNDIEEDKDELTI
jgi:hypothetical protein